MPIPKSVSFRASRVSRIPTALFYDRFPHSKFRIREFAPSPAFYSLLPCPVYCPRCHRTARGRHLTRPPIVMIGPRAARLWSFPPSDRPSCRSASTPSPPSTRAPDRVFVVLSGGARPPTEAANTEVLSVPDRLGFATAVNLGIRHAAQTADHIALLNDDAVPPARWLGALARALVDDAGLAAVQGTITDQSGDQVDGRGITLDRWNLPVQIDRGTSASPDDRRPAIDSGGFRDRRALPNRCLARGVYRRRRSIRPGLRQLPRGSGSWTAARSTRMARRLGRRGSDSTPGFEHGQPLAVAPPLVGARKPVARSGRQSDWAGPHRCTSKNGQGRTESRPDPCAGQSQESPGFCRRVDRVAGHRGDQLAPPDSRPQVGQPSGGSMRVLVATDDVIGEEMAGSATRAWELALSLRLAGHDVRLTAAPGSQPPARGGPSLNHRPSWSWADAVVAPPWSLPPRAFLAGHLLIIDGVTPLLAELDAMPPSPVVIRRRRTASARLPLVAARADAILTAGPNQVEWWSDRIRGRFGLPYLNVPFGIPDDPPPAEVGSVPSVPPDWAMVLWWGGVWPWLDLQTLLAARARLGAAPVSVVVPTSDRPGRSAPGITADATVRHGPIPRAQTAAGGGAGKLGSVPGPSPGSQPSKPGRGAPPPLRGSRVVVSHPGPRCGLGRRAGTTH